SIVSDYTHELQGEEVINGLSCYRIHMVAKENAAVVWGHQVRWIEKENFLFIKSELYDEYGYLVRTESGSEIRELDGRLIPTRLELIPEEEEGHKTIVEIREIEFNIPINDDFFSQQNMKRIR
ncbi:MAG: outer membrane lipoprotein-sorting protein, partial [Bacteroidetes bacterium]